MHIVLETNNFDGEQGMIIFGAFLLLVCVPFTIGYLVWRSRNKAKK